MEHTAKNISVPVRWYKIASIILKYFVFYKLGKYRKDIFGKRLCYACEELGPIFIKFGQLLSTRYDILDDKNCKELQRLLDEVNPLSFETIECIIEKDFGKKLSAIFKDFDKVPIASASIAQVHMAYLHDGTKLAIKIQRPEIRHTIQSDIHILKQVVSFAELFSGELRHVDAKKIVEQLKDWILAEIDFGQEAKNIIRVKEYFIHSTEKTKTEKDEEEMLIIPNVYTKYCSPHVITMEFIDGVPLSKFHSIKDDPKYDAEKSAKACATLSLRHWLTNRDDIFIFHADPHPANVLILPHGKVALVDFGLIGTLTAEETRKTADLFLAVYARNLEQVITCALAISDLSYEKYGELLRSDIKEFLRLAPSKGVGFWFMDFVRIFVKRRLPIPYNMILLGRQNAVVDGLVSTILPGKTTIDIMGDELERAMRKKIMQNVLDTDFSRLAYAVSEEIKKSPDRIISLLNQIEKDPFKIVRDFSGASD